MGYWAFGGIVAASVIAVAVIVACLIYCLCHNQKDGASGCCGESATGSSSSTVKNSEKPASSTNGASNPLKSKGKITVDYTALYDKKYRGRKEPSGGNGDDPVKSAAKKSGWYDSVMWYTMKNKKHRKPSMADALYNEEMSQTSSSHQSSSTTSTDKTEDTSEGAKKTMRNDVAGKHGRGGGNPAVRGGGGGLNGVGKRGGNAPSELSVSTIESDRAGKKKHVSRGPWGEAVVGPKKTNDPTKIKGGGKKSKKLEKY